MTAKAATSSISVPVLWLVTGEQDDHTEGWWPVCVLATADEATRLRETLQLAHDALPVSGKKRRRAVMAAAGDPMFNPTARWTRYVVWAVASGLP